MNIWVQLKKFTRVSRGSRRGRPADDARPDAKHGQTRGAQSLTSEQVEQLRLREEGGESMTSLAREFKVARESLYQFIVRRW